MLEAYQIWIQVILAIREEADGPQNSHLRVLNMDIQELSQKETTYFAAKKMILSAKEILQTTWLM